MKRAAIGVLFMFLLAFGNSAKADSCTADCQTLTVLETLTSFTTVGAPRTVEYLFLNSPNFEVIDTWQGDVFSSPILSGQVDIGVPPWINLDSVLNFASKNDGIVCCSYCPPGSAIISDTGNPPTPVCFDPYVHVYDVTFNAAGLITSSGTGLVSSYLPATPGTFAAPEPGTLPLLSLGLIALIPLWRRRRTKSADNQY